TRGAAQEDKIRWKNQLRKAEELLNARNRHAETKDLLGPAHDLLTDIPFWQNVSNGLAVFLAPGVFRAYRVPLVLDDLVVVAEHFQIKPLLPLLNNEGRFYILALSQTG